MTFRLFFNGIVCKLAEIVSTCIQNLELAKTVSACQMVIPSMRPLVYLCCLLLVACSSQDDAFIEIPTNYPSNLSDPNVSVQIASLGNCTNHGNGDLRLNTSEPVTVIVHGCFSSAGRFRSLAEVFAFHGQQTVCFSYDDRERLTTSASQLKTALEELASVLEEPRISVIGHSQGGLIARHALTTGQPNNLANSTEAKRDMEIELATVSAPFGGIAAAAHCGSDTAAWLSLGIVKLVCQMITGRKYQDIPATSDFILKPGELIPSVSRHLKIVTDETGTCRVHDASGACVEDDFVFSIAEQNQPLVNAQAGLIPLEVKAGHVEIVGNSNQVPTKLIGLLQQQGFLRQTPPEDSENLAKLLAGLYLSPGSPSP